MTQLDDKDAQVVIARLKAIEPSAIVVTGPQRSGTTIAAKIIADELGYEYIDENDVGIDRFDLAVKRILEEEKIVIQCPALSYAAHLFPPQAVIVFMLRVPSQIVSSQIRINWAGNERGEKKKYGMENSRLPISVIKYNTWKDQKAVIEETDKTYFEIEYETLDFHRLWIKKTDRLHFGPRQTK